MLGSRRRYLSRHSGTSLSIALWAARIADVGKPARHSVQPVTGPVDTEDVVTTKDVAGVGLEALRRAKDADDLIWSTQSHSGRYRQLRNRAAAEALSAGIPIEQIADELGVLIIDVERMVEP
jgi:hypothetical protein